MIDITAPENSQAFVPPIASPAKRLGCGSCNMCCILLEVRSIGKPSGMRCWHTGVHGGCEVHASKATDPTLAACHHWRCLFLETQRVDDPTIRMNRDLRPDICHVVMGPQDPEDNTLLYVQVDPRHPGSYLKEPVYSYLKGILDRGGKISLIIGSQRAEFTG